MNKKKLTKRQLEVLKLVAEGYSNKEISNKLFISITTTKTHLNNIYKFLNLFKEDFGGEINVLRVKATIYYIDNYILKPIKNNYEKVVIQNKDLQLKIKYLKEVMYVEKRRLGLL